MSSVFGVTRRPDVGGTVMVVSIPGRSIHIFESFGDLHLTETPILRGWLPAERPNPTVGLNSRHAESWNVALGATHHDTDGGDAVRILTGGGWVVARDSRNAEALAVPPVAVGLVK